MITDKQIASTAEAILASLDKASSGRTDYLRMLTVAVQDALGKKKGQEAAVQLATLRAEHDRFYAVVITSAEAFVPKGTKDRSIELHRRANFARTAASALRGHVRAGGDIAALSPAKVTKGALAAREGPPRVPTPARLKTEAERKSKSLIATLMGLADADHSAAVEEMQLVIAQLTAQLESIGAQPKRGAAAKVPPMVFSPTASQVLRSQARPS